MDSRVYEACLTAPEIEKYDEVSYFFSYYLDSDCI